MRRVDRTPEYLDGHIMVALLRANGIGAALFDENLVRQHWFHVFAYGGFRVMVPESDQAQARDILDACRRGELNLPADDVDIPSCPACHERSGETDPQPRRNVFLAYLAWCLVTGVISMFEGIPEWLVFGMLMAPYVAMLLVPALRHLVIGRYLCGKCGNAWREPMATPFGDLQKHAEAASSSPNG